MKAGGICKIHNNSSHLVFTVAIYLWFTYNTLSVSCTTYIEKAMPLYQDLSKGDKENACILTAQTHCRVNTLLMYLIRTEFVVLSLAYILFLYLNEPRLILLLTQAKAQVLCL